MEPVMSARRVLILCTALSFVLAPLAAAGAAQAQPPTQTPAKPEVKAEAALPTGRTAEAAALPTGRTAEAAAPPAGQTAEKPAPGKKAPAQRTEPIVPAFQTPKEKTAVIVFYVWMWLSIGVLIYFLRWWVQEADRVFKAGFYEPVESPRKDNPFPPYLGE
jgi:hypothetical protein